MKKSVMVLALVALALASCGRTDPSKPETGFMTGLRAVFAFKTCLGKLEDRFDLKPGINVTSDEMDPVSTGRPGEWDVRFVADVTEKETGRVSRYKGVCHVRRDKPTTLDASFVEEIKPAATPGEARRVRQPST